MSDRVHLLGGSGYFGGLLAEDLLQSTRARLCLLGRRDGRLRGVLDRLGPERRRCSMRAVDLRDHRELFAGIEPGDVLVDCAGPFQERDLGVLETCVERGVHYVDIADARSFLARVYERRDLWDRSEACVLAGASTVPGLQVLLARRAGQRLAPLRHVRSWLSIGIDDPRGAATFASLVAELRRPFPMLRGGVLVATEPWSERMSVRFPESMGTREGYLLSGTDSLVLPAYFDDLETVELRVGGEYPWMHRLLAGGRPLLRRFPGAPRTIVRWLLRLLGSMGRVGTGAGGLLVSARGDGAPRASELRLAVHRGEGAPRIAVIAAAVAVSRILVGELEPRRGWVPLDAWIRHEPLVEAFESRGCIVSEEARDLA